MTTTTKTPTCTAHDCDLRPNGSCPCCDLGLPAVDLKAEETRALSRMRAALRSE